VRRAAATAKAAKPAKRAKPAKSKITKGAPRLRRPAAASNRAKILVPAGLGIASTSDAVRALSDSDAKELALACRAAASAKKAEDVLMLDIREKAVFADYFVIATGRSVIQARAIADAVVEAGEDTWGAPLRTEGYNDGTWILVDYGAVTHTCSSCKRGNLQSERLWGKSDGTRRSTKPDDEDEAQDRSSKSPRGAPDFRLFRCRRRDHHGDAACQPAVSLKLDRRLQSKRLQGGEVAPVTCASPPDIKMPM
jgi:ribosome-associated protein